MLYYLSAIGLVAHTCFWGLGLAFLVSPRMWRRWAWVFAPGLGFALQSSVVWIGAHTPVAGTDVYARGSELIPLALLIVAVVRRPIRPAWRCPGLIGVGLIAGWLLIHPLTRPGTGLTTSSLGNCDQADYAAGARVFQEFSRDDRTGFLGLPEVTKVRSVDYFFDFWVHLNHFTPSALIAHNASVFGVESFRLVSISAAALVLLNLPIVFFLGRLMVGLRGAWLVAVVMLYALSPLNAYAVYHGQLGQLYATQGIALLTIAVFGASRLARFRHGVWPFFPLLFASFWLLAGSYNFILPVCLAPAGAWLLVELWRWRNWKAFGAVLALIGGSLGLCAIVFWGRFDGLLERFSLFSQYDFGWSVPLLSPEGLLGLLRDTTLHAWSVPLRITLGVSVAGLWIAGLIELGRRQKSQGLAAMCLVIPVLAGWGVLAWESRVRANASYDAYKIISVFLPGLLAGFVCWLAAVRNRRRSVQISAAFAFLFILVGNFWIGEQFRRSMSNPPLRVNRDIAELAALETDTRFESFNMLIDDYWSRLWANDFLLRKPQYFLIHTYEGRLNTALKGEWNLSDSLLRPIPLREDDFLQFNAKFFVVRAAALGSLTLTYGEGWYPEEGAGSSRWRWSGGSAGILVENPGDRPVQAHLKMIIQSYLPRELSVRLGGQRIALKSLDGSNQVLEIDALSLPSGQTLLRLAAEGQVPGGGDNRRLAFALYGLELHAVALEN